MADKREDAVVVGQCHHSRCRPSAAANCRTMSRHRPGPKASAADEPRAVPEQIRARVLESGQPRHPRSGDRPRRPSLLQSPCRPRSSMSRFVLPTSVTIAVVHAIREPANELEILATGAARMTRSALASTGHPHCPYR